VKILIETPPAPRFTGDFNVKPADGETPTPADQRYLSTLSDVMAALADDEQRDNAADGPPSPLIIARKEARSRTAATLREQADKFNNGLDAETVQHNAIALKGMYRGECERLAGSLFVVRESLAPDQATGVSYANDVVTHVADNLPAPNNAPSPEKQALFFAIHNAKTVIRTVYQRMQSKAKTKERQTQIIQQLDQYMRKLAAVGRLGLEGSHVQLANLALDSLRREFVAQEAGRVKNNYIRSLGIAAIVAVGILSATYAAIQLDFLTAPFWTSHKAFLLAAAGAAVGTWLSFSIRRVSLAFEDLALLEEDMLDPSLRVIFVIGLTVTACLLFWTGAMNIEIGSLKTAQFQGATAFLIGLFSGIAERALATAISGRAASFVRGINGGG
jgi:hypothetical protein